jgi:YgiT-type zinc finger domain-containing protein
MNTKPGPICGEHKTAKEWKQTTFEYSEDGITIRVPNVYAWVCPADGEPAFTPETADELYRAVRELLESAKRTRARRSVLTEYFVSVAAENQLKLAS